MLNLLLTVIILPFIPLWFYGNISHTVGLDDAFNCTKDKSAFFCQNQPRVEGATREFQTPEDGDLKAQEKNGFPIDIASASGFMPVKKSGTPDIKIFAGSSVVIDAETGTILHYDEGKKRTQIASLTKLMTAVMTMERIMDLNEGVVITEESTSLPGTVVGCPRTGYCLSNRLYQGEKVRAIDLLKAALINSANDAATALGVHMAGSAENFVEMMNQKANDIGLKDTHFCTPSGLEIDGEETECYSSAYDIARIAAYSMKYDKIWEIMRIPEEQFYSINGKYMHQLKSTDLIMASTPNYIGVKTGFTPFAGKSLLAGAVDDTKKHKIVAVILNDENRWQDIKSLTDWVFSNYRWQ